MQNGSDRDQMIQHYFKLSALLGIHFEMSFFSVAPEVQQKNRKHRYLRLENYTKQMIRLTDCDSIPDSIILIMDSAGMVLDSWSKVAMPAGSGFSRGDVWSVDQIGANAVTIGMTEKIPFYTVGEENYNRFLQRYAIYFAPVQVRSDGGKRSRWVDGGVAIILPAERADISFLPFVRLMSVELVMYLNHFQQSNWSYQRVGLVFITAAMDFSGTRDVITHYDPKLFDLLGIAPIDLFEKPLVAIFDPLPENEEFWRIIEKKRDISDYEIELTAQGKKASCILSSYVHEQPMLEFNGVDLVITTRKTWPSRSVRRSATHRCFPFRASSPGRICSKR